MLNILYHKDSVFWGTKSFTTDKREVLQQVIHKPGPGEITRFPIDAFLKAINTAIESKKATHLVVISDKEIKLLLDQKSRWVHLIKKNPNLVLEFIYNPKSGQNGPEDTQIKKICRPKNIVWHTLDNGWDGLVQHTRKRARTLFKKG